jgi:hypothetical protein
MMPESDVNILQMLGVAGFYSLTNKKYLSGTVWSEEAAVWLTSDKLNGLLGAADVC